VTPLPGSAKNPRESAEIPTSVEPSRILILGAAGRDFHLFNVLYRETPEIRVVAFTAQQIPHIADRRYPPELAGPHYPDGIPIHPEERLETLIRELEVDRCILAYSDLSHAEVMHLASRANTAGAGFELPDPHLTMLRSRRKVVAVCASRTGAGKSQTTRALVRIFRRWGRSVAVIRHPMPYGDLIRQRVQRFASEADLAHHRVTIEEREEYEPHLASGSVVFAGVDYQEILREAEKEADLLIWDGGNNDTSFLRADLYLTVVDPHRPGHELQFHPGETNLRLADVVIVNKVDTARFEDVLQVLENIRAVNPDAQIIEAASPLHVDDVEVLRGRKVLCIEDGPTLTHGGMAYGAGTLGARRSGAAEIVDPRPFVSGELAETFRRYPHMGSVLPAMGYGDHQIRELETAVARAARAGMVEAVAVGTPIALDRLINLPVPHTRVRYELQSLGSPSLEEVLAPLMDRVEDAGTP
jgi:predicted GTPase